MKQVSRVDSSSVAEYLRVWPAADTCTCRALNLKSFRRVARIAMLVSATLASYCAYSDTWTDSASGYTWTYTVANGTAEITSVSPKPTGELDIPAILGGNSVASIGFSVFSNCGGLTKVTIPDGVMYIQDNAFKYCRGLTSVAIPDSVKVISYDAFYCCDGLTCVFINDLIKWCEISFGNWYANPLTYANDIYLDGEKIESLTIPKSVTNIASYIFTGCSGLTSVTIGNSVTNIGTAAFKDCSGLTSVTIGDSVMQIGCSAFSGCYSLTGVHVTDLSKWCCISFEDSSANPLAYAGDLYLDGEKITALTLPNSVKSIGSYAFRGCRSLTNVTIPDSVTGIGYQAFYGCIALTSLRLPQFANIGDEAFYNCTALTSLTLPQFVLDTGVSRVISKQFVTNVVFDNGVTNISASAFCNCNALTSVTIPEGVISIGDDAFFGCGKLMSLTIPRSVTSYGVGCFDGCPAYTLGLYRAIFGDNSSGGSPMVVTTVVQNVEAPYTLSSQAADRTIASVTVNGDCSIDSFVLKDGKVYDSMLYVSNTADREVVLSLPSGYSYKTIKGATPLTMPASSQCLISITRVDANVFLVMREELDDVK